MRVRLRPASDGAVRGAPRTIAVSDIVCPSSLEARAGSPGRQVLTGAAWHRDRPAGTRLGRGSHDAAVSAPGPGAHRVRATRPGGASGAPGRFTGAGPPAGMLGAVPALAPLSSLLLRRARAARDAVSPRRRRRPLRRRRRPHRSTRSTTSSSPGARARDFADERDGPRVVRGSGARVRAARGPARLRRTGRADRADRRAAPAGRRRADRLAGDEPGRPGRVRDGASARRSRAGLGREPARRSASTSSDSTRAASARARRPSTAWTTPSGRPSAPTSTSTRPRRASRRPRRRTSSTRSGAPSAPVAPTCWPTSAPATSSATWTSCVPALGRREADLPRLLLRHPHRLRLRRGVPAERAGAGARRRARPGRRPPCEQHGRAGRRLPAGVRRVRRRLRDAGRTARSAPTRRRPPPRFQAITRPLIDRPGAGRGGARTLSYPDAVAGHDPGAVPVGATGRCWPGASSGAGRRRRHDPAARWPTCTTTAAPDGHYGNLIEAFIGDQLRRRAAHHRPGRAGASSPAGATRPRRSGTAAAARSPRSTRAPSGRCRRPASRTCRRSQGLPPTLVISTTGDPATPYQAGVDLAKALNGEPADGRGQPAHGGPAGHHAASTTSSLDYLVDLHTPGSAPPVRAARCDGRAAGCRATPSSRKHPVTRPS